MHRSSACSSAARLSALSLTRRWSAVDLSRVHRSSVSSSFCWSAAFLSLVLPLLCLFVRHWSLTGPALVSHWSVAGLSARQSLLCHLSVAAPSPRVVVADLSARLLSLLCRCSVAPLPDRPSGRASLVCRSTAPLGCSTPLHSAARLHSTRLLYCSTPLALRAFLFYLLVEFGRHAVHTHSVPRVVSRHSVITHSLFHSCSHRRCCLVWSSA